MPPIDREEVGALLFAVYDVSSTLTNIERLLEEDDGEEEIDGGGARRRKATLVLEGHCECRATRYRVADEFLYALNCHCSNCRAGTGSAFKAFAGIEKEKLEIYEGGDSLFVWGDADNNHTRCGTCGGLLFSTIDGKRVHVALGALADAPSIRPSKHIFVGSKAPWFEILDDLPQFHEHAD